MGDYNLRHVQIYIEILYIMIFEQPYKMFKYILV